MRFTLYKLIGVAFFSRRAKLPKNSMHIATSNGNIKVLKAILDGLRGEYITDIDEEDTDLRTPIFIAASKNDANALAVRDE